MFELPIRAVAIAALAVLAGIPTFALAQQGATLGVEAVDGNLFLVEGQQRRQLTRSGRDADAILAPDQKSVVFTRFGKARDAGTEEPAPGECSDPPDELRRIGADGTGEELILRGRITGSAEERLCDFSRKQFASDGRTLYFLSPAWAVSAALHTVDVRSKTQRFVMAANDILVLSTCTKADYRDHLVVQQHRYFLLGGSYDWYWLYDPAGAKEMGPIGEAENTEAIQLQIEDAGHCR